MAHTQYEVSEEALHVISIDLYVLLFQFRNKALYTEPILFWMFKKRPIGPAVERVRCYLFEEEPPSSFEHSGDFRDRAPPVGHVVNDPEVEHRVVALILRVDTGGVADE